MYCKKCGKLLPGDADICRDCFDQANRAAQQTPYYGRPPVVGYPADRDNRMYGFGRALASTIMSEGAFLALIWSFFMFIELLIVEGGRMEAMVAVIVYMGLVAVIVLALIFGISSISAYKRRSNEGCAKPVATLVLGIIGVVGSAVALFYSAYFGVLYFSMLTAMF